MEGTGGFGVGLDHPVEPYIRRTFGVNEMELKRLAYFVLAHVLVDTRLIATALFYEISQRGGSGGLSLNEIQQIADKVAAGTFGRHLKRVANLVPPDCCAIAYQLNWTRNTLLHWDRSAFAPQPVYKGEAIASASGFLACMNDVLHFIQTVPWNRL